MAILDGTKKKKKRKFLFSMVGFQHSALRFFSFDFVDGFSTLVSWIILISFNSN